VNSDLGIALIIPIQAWWADFAMRRQLNWTFLVLLVVMLQAIRIYMTAALVLPDVSGERFINLREHFFARPKLVLWRLFCEYNIQLGKNRRAFRASAHSSRQGIPI
jgi:hypothetical protein